MIDSIFNENFKIAMIFCLIYFVCVSIIAIILTISDKKRAEKGLWRVPERTLMLTSFFGGAIAMLATMKKIRHKTQHKLFMIGIPLIIVFHFILIAGLVYFIAIR